MALIIDADSHIEDNDEIWENLDPEYRDRRPHILEVGNIISERPERNYVWFVDGDIFPKLMGYGATCYGTPAITDFGKRKPISVGAQDLTDVTARLKAMDDNHVDVSVLFSTLFLQPVSKDTMYEAALMRAYNTYMAGKVAESKGRLQWAAPIPLQVPSEAVRELRRARELGAIGIMLLGTAGNVLLHDRRFDPVWQAAQELSIPLCVHVGWAHPGLHDTCESPASGLILAFDLSMVMGFFSFLGGGILDRFPGLKVLFVEGAIDAYPLALQRMALWYETPTAQPWPARHPANDYLKNCAVYFTCEGDEES